jgi:hypothetical protein
MRIMAGFVAIDQEIVITRGEAELVARNSGEGLECRPRGAPAVRAMTIGSICKLVHHRIANGTTKTFSGENTSV